MKLKDLVIEKRMSGREYQKVFGRVGEGALVGFEIEALVPPEAPLHKSKGHIEFDTIRPHQIKSMSMIHDLFNVSAYDDRKIELDFGNWLAEQEDEHIENTYRDYLNDDEDNEREAKEDARSNFKEPSIDDWVKREVGGFDTLIDRYELEPTFGVNDQGHIYTEPVEDVYSAGMIATMEATAAALAKELGAPVNANGSFHNGWVVTTDTSIKEAPDAGVDDNMTSYGLELISPPQKLDVAFKQLDTVLKFVDDEFFVTNFSTGIHINISLPNMGKIDVVKLVLFMGDKYVLDKFDRSTNVFAGSQLRRIIDGIESNGKLPTGIDDIRDAAMAALKVTEKYSSVNLKHLPTYLEFRAAGGDDYHRRIDDIKELIGRWISTIEIATDPLAARNEYIKKLYKLLDKTNTSKTKMSSSELTFADWLKKTSALLSKDLANLNDTSEKIDRLDVMADVMDHTGRAFGSGTVNSSYQWRKEIRELFSKIKISAAEIMAHEKNALIRKHISLAFKEFKLA